MEPLPSSRPRRNIACEDRSEVALGERDVEVWVDACLTSTRARLVDQVCLTLTRRGCGRARSGGAQLMLLPGVVMLVPPGQLCIGGSSNAEGWESVSVLLQVDARTAPGARATDGAPLLTASGPLADALEDAARDLERGRRPRLSSRELGALLVDPYTAFSRPSRTSVEHVLARRTRELLRERPTDTLTLNAIAHAAGGNKWSLLRAFTRHMGVSPAHYQRLLRVALARNLLASGRSVADATYGGGFCDQSHLNRCFKSAFGVTPGRYAVAVTQALGTRLTPPRSLPSTRRS